MLRDYQQQASDAAYNYFTDKKAKYNAVEVLPTGCHAKGSKILMYNGTLKKAEDVVIGDYLMGDNSEPRRVLELHHGIDKMYEIIPIKGEPFTVNGGHILSLYKTNEGNKYECEKPRIDEISVQEYISKSKNYKHLHKLYKPKFINFGKKQPVIEPYFLGLYLGDGSSVCGVNITTQRKEVVDFLYNMVSKYDMKISKYTKPGNLASTYAFSNIKVSRSNPNKIIDYLDKLDLKGVTSGFKFIPFEYKTSSRTERLELLAGLLDTDAYYDQRKNMFEYCSKSIRLSEDIVFLCRSLGFFAQIGKTKIVKDEKYYRIQISGDLDTVPIKVEIRKAKPREQKKSVLVTGFDVKYKGKGNYYGFTIDGNHLYCDHQLFVHHNSGKSHVIADVAARLKAPILIFQPSKEILQQNFAKMQAVQPFGCSIYSASFNSKEIGMITFATIGSVKGHPELFEKFPYVIVDECHSVNPRQGMYKDFFEAIGNTKILGLTATPYRLTSYMSGSMLKFITRTRPNVFSKVIYQVQVKTLLDMGYLAKLRYFQMNMIGWNADNLKVNSTGADYTDKSLIAEYERVGFYGYLVDTVKRLINPKAGRKPHGILVFTRFVKEAMQLTQSIQGCEIVTGETPKKERERILTEFKSGKIPVVANVGVLTTGFDYPELDTIVMARPTMSLAMYYQIVGRAIRPFKGKEGWFVDLCGNIDRFGHVDDLRLEDSGNGKWAVFSNGKQLTNVLFQ